MCVRTHFIINTDIHLVIFAKESYLVHQFQNTHFYKHFEHKDSTVLTKLLIEILG